MYLWHVRTSHIDHGVQDFAAAVRQLGCDLERWPEEQRQRALQMLVHACDIGNPAKSLHSTLLWRERLLAENFAQVGAAPAHMSFIMCVHRLMHVRTVAALQF